MPGPSDLVLCSSTLPRAATFTGRLDAATAGGFGAISFWGRDDAAAAADRANGGITVDAWHWFRGNPDAARRAGAATRAVVASMAA